jgi:polysaccharide biosynthesis/export protein
MLGIRNVGFCEIGRKICFFVALSVCTLLLVGPARCQTPAGAGIAKAPPATPVQLETAQEANDRISQLAMANSSKQGDYVIGSGDLLNIEVFEVPELSRDVRVNESGFISLPLLPVKVHVSGLTPFQLQDSLGELLRSNGLVSNPQITVSLKDARSEPITVIGAVKSPGVIQAVHQLTLLEVLSQVGGIAGDAGSEILITRVPKIQNPDGTVSDVPGQPVTITVDLNDLLDSGDSKYNIPLIGGDSIRVPRAGVVYVVGAVLHAGGFVMANDRQQLTVLKAVTLAGGLQPTAKPQDAIILRRSMGSTAQQHLPVDLHKILKLKSEDVGLEQSDILYVPDSAGKHAMRRAGDIALSLASGVALVCATQ